MREFYPVMHILTGPPPLDRNGGIWKVIKRDLSKTIKAPKILVQAFHFTTYDLSKRSWDVWTGNTQLSIKTQMKNFFPGGSVFVDSGGYQFLQGDKVDLSKWKLEATQSGIYALQRYYGANSICNLDFPVPPYLDSKSFKKTVKANISNIQILSDLIRDDKTDIFFVIHGRNQDEIRYFYRKLKGSVDLSEEKFDFALGSQVPLIRMNRRLVSENIDYTQRLIKRDFGITKKLHIFGVGASIINQVEESIDISYDNSTFVRNAMYLRWFDPETLSYKDFSTNDLEKCECFACSVLRSISPRTIVDTFSNPHIPGGLTKSDIMGYIALHNMYYEKDKLGKPKNKLPAYSSGEPVTKSDKALYKSKRIYSFPLRQYSPSSENLVILKCTATKPYSKSISHIHAKNHLEEALGIKEGVDYDVVTLSGLYGPVHWKDETRPEIMNYDFRLTNMTSPNHILTLQLRTSTVISNIVKKYSRSYSIINGMYYRTFGGILERLGVTVFQNVDSFSL